MTFQGPSSLRPFSQNTRMRLSPYPAPAEILHSLNMESGMVSATNEGKDAGRYRLLNRMRSAGRFAPWQAAEQSLEHAVELIDQAFPACAAMLKAKLQGGLEDYSGLSETISAECIERKSLVDEFLWPDVFAPWAAGALMALRQTYPGIDPWLLLVGEHPFASLLRQRLSRESLSVENFAIQMGAAREDPTDGRKRVDRWLVHGHVPQAAQLKALSRLLGDLTASDQRG